MKRLSERKIVRGGFLAVFAAVYFLYLYFAFSAIPIDSDWASLNLEAADILSGNVLLRGWNFTGATFLFTELPLYLPGAALFGVSTASVLLAIALGGTLIFFAGFFLLRRGLSGDSFWISFFFYTALAGIPTLPLLKTLRAHVGVFILFFPLIALAERLRREERISKRAAALYFALLALAAASDLFIVTLFAVPVLVFLGWMALGEGAPACRDGWLMGLTAGAAAAGKLIERLYLAAGNTPLNSRVGLAKWAGETAILEYARNFVFGCMKLFGASAGETAIFSPGSAAVILKLCVFLIGAGILGWNLARFFRREWTLDFFSAILSLAIVCHGAWVVAGGFSLNMENTLRYYAFFPYAIAVLILRPAFRSDFFSRKLRGAVSFRTLAIAGCALIVALTFRLPSTRRVIAPQDRLATFLYESGYTSGYGDFWTASQTVVSSRNRVALRALSAEEGEGKTIRPYLWFNRTDWYDDPSANFIVVNLRQPSMYMSAETVRNFFGPPIREKRFDDYLILEYPEGLNRRFPR